MTTSIDIRNNFSAITISIFVAMNVSKFIAELLMHHDCLIIPGFGVITGEEKSAGIHPVQHSFQPPEKFFSFNAATTGGDNLLVELISKKEVCSKEFATKTVRGFVEEIKNSLKEKGAYELKGIGKFYLDIEKKLRFISQPDKNYLLSSFGLPEFISKPVLHPENIPAYSPRPLKQERKKRKFIWFRF